MEDMLDASKHNRIAKILIASLMLMVFGVARAAEAPPNIIAYQGRVLNTNSVPVSDASLDMKFFLYDASGGGSCVWSNDSSDCHGGLAASVVARSVTLTSGLFTENLGDTGASYAAIGDTVFGDHSTLYLEVMIDGETLSPRRRLTSAPYALNAQLLDGTDSTGFLASTGDTATGNFDFTGAELVGASPIVFEGGSDDGNTTTFAFVDPTGSNTVTFQDASGTVAFLSDVGSGEWETGSGRLFEDDYPVVVGTNGAFSYASGAVGDLRIGDEFETVDDGYIGADLVVGASTSSTETLSHSSFTLGGDDLFVAGDAGVEGFVYTDSGLIVGSGTTFGNGAITTTGTTDLLLTIAGGDLTFGQATVIGGGTNTLSINSSDWDISTTGDLTGIGGITMDGSFSQTGAGTFSTGTGVINLNGAVTAGSDLTVTSGARVGTGSTPDSFTALADDSLFVEGQIEVDGAARFDGTLTVSDLTCTDCLDFDSFADSMTLDAATSIATAGFALSTSGTGALSFNSTGQVTFGGNVDATNGLDVTNANLTVGGANFSVAQATGTLTTAGDIAVNGGDVTTTATTWNFDVGNTGSILFRDGTNTLLTVADNGTVGDVSATGSLSSGTTLTAGTDLTVTSGARVGTGSTADHLTALADDSVFVEGESEFDGDMWIDNDLTVSGTASLGDITCTDCLDFDSFADSMTLDATTQINLLASQSLYLDVGGAGGSLFGVRNSGEDNIFIVDENGHSTFYDDVSLALAGSEQFEMYHDFDGTIDIAKITGIPTSTAGTANGLLIDQQFSTNVNGLDNAIVVNNSDNDLAIGTGITFTSTGGGAITTAFDASLAAIGTALAAGANDLSGTNWSITGSSGDVVTAGDVAVNGGDITATGNLRIDPAATNSLLLATAANVNSATIGSVTLDQIFITTDSGTPYQDIYFGGGMTVNDETYFALGQNENVFIENAAVTGTAPLLRVTQTSNSSNIGDVYASTIDLTLADYVDDATADTRTALKIDVTNNASDGGNDDNIYGLVVGNLGGTAHGDGTEYAIYQQGSSWDAGLYIEDVTSLNATVQINLPEFSVVEVDAASTNSRWVGPVFGIDVDTQTDGNMGLQVDYEDIDASGGTVAAIDVLGTMTSINDDNLYGLRIQDLAGTADDGNEYAIYQAGTSWDYGLYSEGLVYHNNATTSTGVTIDQDGNGTALFIDAASTSASVVSISSTSTTDGAILNIGGGDFTNDTGLALMIDVTEDFETADIIKIQTNYSSINNNVFRIEADGEAFSDVGFTAGSFSTHYFDGELETTGDYLLDIDGGDLTFDQATIIGDGGDALTINSSGTLSIDDATLAGTGAFTIQSGGGGALAFDSASGIVSTASNDDFVVGNNSSLVAAFSVDESANKVRVGDAADTNAQIDMYASNAESGSIIFTDGDYFNFDGGGINAGYFLGFTDENGTEASTVINTGVSPGGTLTGNKNHYSGYFAIGSEVDKDGNTYNLIGLDGTAVFSSNSAAGPNETTGVNGLARLSSNSQTAPLMVGVKGTVDSTVAGGTITRAIGVRGNFVSGSGSVTEGYGGWFENIAEGTTRYGILGSASGGTNNYSGYFFGSAVHIDDDVTPNTPSVATGAGDLYVADAIEADGNVDVGGTVNATNLTCTDCLNFDSFLNNMSLDENTQITMGGSQTFSILNNATGNLVFNMQSTGDFIVQDNGSAVWSVTDMGGVIHIPNNMSGTPSNTGSAVTNGAHTFTDNNTAASGTAMAQIFYGTGAPTLAAVNSNVTTTNAATMYIQGAPIAGTNMTITNPFAFWVDSGDSRFDETALFNGDASFRDDVEFSLQGAETISITNSTATDDVLSVAVSSADKSAQYIDFSLLNDSDNDELAALVIEATSAATGDADELKGLWIKNISGADLNVIERGIEIGDNWDFDISFVNSTARLQIPDSGNIGFIGSTGNTAFVSFEDTYNSTSNHSILTDSDTALSFHSLTDATDIDITSHVGSNDSLRIRSGGTGDTIFYNDADSQVQVTTSAVLTSGDMFSVSNTGYATATDGVHGINIDYSVGNASASALNINPSFAGGASDTTFRAIGIGTESTFAPTNSSGTDTALALDIGGITDDPNVNTYAIRFGDGWDYDMMFYDNDPIVGINDGQKISFVDNSSGMNALMVLKDKGTDGELVVDNLTSSNHDLAIYAASGSTSTGYKLVLNGGQGNGAGYAGGDASITGGAGASAGSGGNGGKAIVAGGSASGDGTIARSGGAVEITSGNGLTGGLGGDGGTVTVTAGSSSTAGNGGEVQLNGGASAAGNGGNIKITAGTRSGAATHGNVFITSGGSAPSLGGLANGDVGIAATDEVDIYASNTIDIKSTMGASVNITGTVDISGTVVVDLQAASTAVAVCSTAAGGGGAATDVVLKTCTGAPIADYAEQYPVEAGVEYGDIVVPGTDSVVTTDGDIISKLIKSTEAYSGPVVGIVSNNYGNFTSAGYNIAAADNPMPVALVGRVPVKVTNENGVIAVGDYLTTSSTPGYAMKATKVGRVIGMALSTFDGTTGMVMVQVNNGWYMGDIIGSDGESTLVTDNVVVSAMGEATASEQTFDSFGLALRGSAWNGSEAQAVEMMMQNVVDDADHYRLSITNSNESEVAYITNEGTMRIAGNMVIGGNIYPSDRGTAQTEKFIYYDGSSGPAGDFMRTNAKGWSTGSYDFAEMFPSTEALEPGDVVMFAGDGERVRRTASSSEKALAGIVSTRPGFLAGENVAGSYPIALAGRVPTRVTLENGAIQVGDPLTSSSISGAAMKATEAGSIIGYALESYTGSEGDALILTYVNVGYWGGEQTSSTPGTQNTASEFGSVDATNISTLSMTGGLFMNTHSITGIGRISGMGELWNIESDGTIQTEALVKNIITTVENKKVETVAVTSPEVLITLSGTAELVNGQAEVRFENVAPEFNDVINVDAPIRIVATPNGPSSIYVSEKDQNHFVVKSFAGDESVQFDWIVTAYRRGFEQTKIEDQQPGEDIVLSEDGQTPVGVSNDSVQDEEVDVADEVAQEQTEEVVGEETADEVTQKQTEEVEEEEPATPESSELDIVDSTQADEGDAHVE